jgi:hypothetical protein
VERDRLVDASVRDRYLALSYVWGSVPMFKTERLFLKALYEVGGLKKHVHDISATVQDAFKVVKALRERYLWVDSICIVQDDIDDKRHVIGNMHVIYSFATLTIVAADGRDAEAGLPGLYLNSRPMPVVFEYSCKLSLLPGSDPHVKISYINPWPRRAWTFQEAELSPRLLVFTNICIHFTCDCAIWSEDLCENTSNRFGPVFCLKAELNVERTRDTLGDLWQHVGEELSRRDMTNDTDILYTAARLLGLLEKVYSETSIYSLPESCIEYYIYWTPSGSRRRRRRVNQAGRPWGPSWSWCGWMGTVDCHPGPVKAIEREDSPALRWYKCQSIKSPPVLINNIYFGQVRTRSPETLRVGNFHLTFLDRQWPFLWLSTWTSQFQIAKTNSAPKWIQDLQPSCWRYTYSHWEEHRHRHRLITCKTTNRPCGLVLIDAAEIESMIDTNDCEFILVSSLQLTLDNARYTGHPSTMHFSYIARTKLLEELA